MENDHRPGSYVSKRGNELYHLVLEDAQEGNPYDDKTDDECEEASSEKNLLKRNRRRQQCASVPERIIPHWPGKKKKKEKCQRHFRFNVSALFLPRYTYGPVFVGTSVMEYSTYEA
jgi:hypothetical protein